ncbi:MAG: translation initiation factor IF-2 [Alphaproteobacteria bacterium]|nr:translation initiation factor IF-2 [Alphaproteobacteria bacterium]
MSDDKNIKKPLSIGGRTIGGKPIAKKPITIGGLGVKKTSPIKNTGNEDKKNNSDIKRKMKILENAGDVSKKLRKDAEDAVIRSQEQTRLKEEADKRKEMAERRQKETETVKKSVEQKTSSDKPAESNNVSPPVVNPVVKNTKDSVEKEKEKFKAPKKARKGEPERRQKTKFTVADALTESDENFDTPAGPSLASVRRRREKEKIKAREALMSKEKIVREVVIPETITVGDLANRMAERTADVIKELMKLGIMANSIQQIDADTAELIVSEFGHKFTRVSESDVEDILISDENDAPETLETRAPVVTIMGHVDHGKTSLLDALRETDVVSGEAGGITQHIGAYNVTLSNGRSISFLDTPGHEAFTQMRQRGANVTDIVVLVVAANDGIMPQTIEAINHAQAANVPIIVAINKIDVEGADAQKVQTQLLEHSVQTEHFGGEVLAVEVSAKLRKNLDKLEEAILLQSDLLELKANPNANPRGHIVEAKMEKGRGSVATVLIQKGTLRNGQIFVAGTQWGRVRSIINDKGKNQKDAGPSLPVEVLGWNGAPQAGDEFVVVENEAQARQITEYRIKKELEEKNIVSASKGSIDDIFAQIKQGQIKELPIIIKADTQGSVEAIKSSVSKFDNDEIKVNVVHSGTGGITESDVSLASSMNGLIFGFNVRANSQARDLAEKNNQDLRYYSIIYDLIDDVKQMLSGMLAPEISENLIGYAEIRQVFKVTKLGNIAGCYVNSGIVKRGAGVRLLRDDVVIYEGSLKQLKREKNDAKEVKQNYECGMMFENYDDIKEGDVVECFEKVEKQRQI